MKDSIYKIYGCRNKQELYRKVKEGSYDVKDLISFIDYLRSVRTEESARPFIDSTSSLARLVEKENFDYGNYFLLLDTQNKVIKAIKSQEELDGGIKDLVRETYFSGAKSIIFISNDKNFSGSPALSAINKAKNLRNKIEDFDIILLDGLFYSKSRSDAYSFARQEQVAFEAERTADAEKLFNFSEEKEGLMVSEPLTDISAEEFKEIKKSSDFIEHYVSREIKGKSMADDFDEVTELLRAEYSEKSVETFGVIFLDRNDRIISKEEFTEGTLDRSTIYVREFFKLLLKNEDKYNGIAIFHNHPSGSLRPSRADVLLTEKLDKMSKLMNIDLKEHIIISRRGAHSFQKEGVLEDKYKKPESKKKEKSGKRKTL